MLAGFVVRAEQAQLPWTSSKCASVATRVTCVSVPLCVSVFLPVAACVGFVVCVWNTADLSSCLGTVHGVQVCHTADLCLCACVHVRLCLFLPVSQAIPGLSPVPWWGTLFPLAVVLMVNGVKEAFDDYWRHKSDEQVGWWAHRR